MSTTNTEDSMRWGPPHHSRENRAALIAELVRVSGLFPGMRIGQLLENAITTYEERSEVGARFTWSVFYAPDDFVARALADYARRFGKA